MLADAIELFLQREGCTKVQRYWEYVWRCNQLKIRAVSLRAFCRRLRGHPAYRGRPRLPLFLACAVIDETTFDLSIIGGSSS